jgi:hypothetical protein
MALSSPFCGLMKEDGVDNLIGGLILLGWV